MQVRLITFMSSITRLLQAYKQMRNSPFLAFLKASTPECQFCLKEQIVPPFSLARKSNDYF